MLRGERFPAARLWDCDEATSRFVTPVSCEDRTGLTSLFAVLQLYNNPSQEWAEFLHTEDRKWTNFDQVREEIVRETDREAGNNKVMI